MRLSSSGPGSPIMGSPTPTQRSTAALIGLVGPNFGLEEGGKVLESRGGGQQFSMVLAGFMGWLALCSERGAPSESRMHQVTLLRAIGELCTTRLRRWSRFRAGFHT